MIIAGRVARLDDGGGPPPNFTLRFNDDEAPPARRPDAIFIGPPRWRRRPAAAAIPPHGARGTRGLYSIRANPLKTESIWLFSRAGYAQWYVSQLALVPRGAFRPRVACITWGAGSFRQPRAACALGLG